LSKQRFILEESPRDTMADQRTMAELLRAPIERGSPPMARKRTLAFYSHLGGSSDQDSLNAAACGNLLERRTQDVLTIIKNKSKDNIQGYVSAAAVNYNQGNFVYHPSGMANQIRPPGFAQPKVQNNKNRFGQPQGFNRGNNFNPEQSYQAPTQRNQNVPLKELEKVKRMNEANMKAMKTQINMVKNELRNEMKSSILASLSNQTNEIKNMMASLFLINTPSTSGSGSLLSNTVANPKGELKAITTQSGHVLDGPTVPTPPPFINPEQDECVEETLSDSYLFEYTIKVPPPPDQKYNPPSQREYKMLKALLSNKEKCQELANTPLNENCSTVILKKLPKKLGDPGKFLVLCGFSELKCKALANLGVSIKLMPLSVWKKLVGKFIFLADLVIVDYESNPRVPLILGRPFLQTTRALIDVHSEEMSLRDDFVKDLFSNQPSGNPTFSSHPELTSPEVKNNILDPEGGNVLPWKLLDLDSIEDLHPPLLVNPLSGSSTYSSSPLLEEFTDELTFITFHSSLKASIDQSNLADNFVDSMPEMFTDEHAPDYSSPSIFDEYDDDFSKVESNTENVYDDPFDSKGEKINESKLLIDKLDLPCDFLTPSEYDSFIS
nr:hypothetical protein [Tanacetum cinerariifolium]